MEHETGNIYYSFCFTVDIFHQDNSILQVQWHIPFSPRSNSNPATLETEPDQEEEGEEMEQELEQKPGVSVTRKKLMTPFRIPFK